VYSELVSQSYPTCVTGTAPFIMKPSITADWYMVQNTVYLVILKLNLRYQASPSTAQPPVASIAKDVQNYSKDSSSSSKL